MLNAIDVNYVLKIQIHQILELASLIFKCCGQVREYLYQRFYWCDVMSGSMNAENFVKKIIIDLFTLSH